MRIAVPTPDGWGRLSEQYRAALSLKETQNLNIQVYAGVGHAVAEVTNALARLYTTKKTIAVVSGVDPTFERVSVAFSQDGFVVKSLTLAQANDAATWLPFIDDLLFVLTCDDDPVTGRLYPFETATFAGKRIFRLHVSHEAHRSREMKRPEPFVANILGLSTDRALMVAGERVKIEPQLAPALHWPPETADEISSQLEPHSYDSAEVIAFENSLPSGFKAYFEKDAARVFDRTVIYHAQYDGSAVIEELSQTMQVPLTAPGENTLLEATSACRWESPRFNDWLLFRGETEATARGLIVISSTLIGRGVRLHLETAAGKISKLQNG